MATENPSGMALPPVEQIGIVVKDLDQAITFYERAFGWGPFQIMESPMKGVIFRGKSTDCRIRIATCRSGDIEIELLQILEGETPHTEFLSEKGEGVHHLRFRVDDMAGTLARLARAGIEPIWHQNLPQFGVSFAYLDTAHIGGTMIELIEIQERKA